MHILALKGSAKQVLENAGHDIVTMRVLLGIMPRIL
jgi:hypothetical protein